MEVEGVVVWDEASCEGVGAGLSVEVRDVGLVTCEGRADVLRDATSQIRAMVQGGGNFVVAAPMREMKRWCSAKVLAIRGREADDEKDVVVLGRSVRWNKEVVELEAVEKHGRLIHKELGIMPGSDGVVSPAARVEADDENVGEKLNLDEAPKYRVVLMMISMSMLVSAIGIDIAIASVNACVCVIAIVVVLVTMILFIVMLIFVLNVVMGVLWSLLL